MNNDRDPDEQAPDDTLHAFHDLRPDAILDAVEAVGYRCDGHISALNSYENRVYQVGIEDAAPVIAKFYRPGRWSDDCILEEHAFTAELAELEVPVITPLVDGAGKTLFHAGLHRLALYPRIGGRPPEPDNPDHLLMLGHMLGRIHNVGASHGFSHRPRLDIEDFAVLPQKFLMQNGFVPPELVAAYSAVTDLIIARLRQSWAIVEEIDIIRLHGDFHLGNVLMRDDVPWVVDFDDSRMGPAMQDVWMLLSGDHVERTAALYDVLEGYCEFRDFDARELQLVEPLRTLRIMHFAGWLARRWDDPAFPRAFPWFNHQRYWEEHILTLREQLAALDEPALVWRRG